MDNPVLACLEAQQALGFTELPGISSENVRRLLGISPQNKGKKAAEYLQPLELVGSGGPNLNRRPSGNVLERSKTWGGDPII